MKRERGGIAYFDCFYIYLLVKPNIRMEWYLPEYYNGGQNQSYEEFRLMEICVNFVIAVTNNI